MRQDVELGGHPLIWALPILFLLVALFPLPYGYYNLLRLVVTICAGFLVYTEIKQSGPNLWSVLFFSIALLFNPIIPIHLTREIWIFLDILVAAGFALHWFAKRPA